MINFNLPGFYEHFSLNIFFIKNLEKHPEWFYPDIKIHSVYGNFPYCTWDGGRIFGSNITHATKEEIKLLYDFFQEHNVALRFIFTNPVLQPQHLHQHFENLILSNCYSLKNEIVVNNPLIEEYLKHNYPNYKIISSTTKRLNKEQFLKELDKDYFQICLDYDLNKDLDFLNSIPEYKRDKIEFLVNAICPPNCKFRKQHYIENGKKVLSYDSYDYSDKIHNRCGIEHNINHPAVLTQGNNLSIQEIYQYYQNGFVNFKLEGRTLPDSTLFVNYLYYLIQPAFKYEVLDNALNEKIIITTNNYSVFG